MLDMTNVPIAIVTRLTKYRDGQLYEIAEFADDQVHVFTPESPEWSQQVALVEQETK